jgi:hypothetical protein
MKKHPAVSLARSEEGQNEKPAQMSLLPQWVASIACERIGMIARGPALGVLCFVTAAMPMTGLAQAPIRRDSAGVEIVQYTGGSADAPSPFRLAAQPKLVIGLGGSDARYELSQISGAARLSNGTIVIANGATSELRYFDSAGTNLRGVGRRGQIPGAIMNLSAVRRGRNDTVAVYDAYNERVSFFDAGGRFVRDVQFGDHVVQRLDSTFGVLADGSMLLRAVGGQIRYSEVTTRDFASLMRVAPSGAVLADLGYFPGRQRISVQLRSSSIETVVLPRVETMFAIVPSVATDEMHFYFVDGGSYELTEFDTAGALQRVIRVSQAPFPVTPQDIARWRDSTPQESWTPFLAEHAPKTMPALRRVLSDHAGRMWVEEFPHPTARTAIWTAFTPDGSRLGSVRVPIDLHVLEWGRDYLLASRLRADATEDAELFDLSVVGARRGGTRAPAYEH